MKYIGLAVIYLIILFSVVQANEVGVKRVQDYNARQQVELITYKFLEIIN